jgi:hypothetical protein
MERKQPPSKQLIIQKDIDCAQQSPSHIDHAEMDLSDDSLTPGGAQDSSIASGGKVNQDPYHE